MSNLSALPPENGKPTTSKQMSQGSLAVAKFLIGVFSTSERQREPPSATKTSHIRLITISVSHYCEKVRWALDYLEGRDDNPYYYTEDAHPPGLQSYETLKVSNEEASITPMIVYEENGKREVLYDSTKILKFVWPELYPKAISAAVEAMEADLGKRLGPGLRCYAYYHLLAIDVAKYHEMFVNMAAHESRVAKIERIVTDKFLEKGFAAGILKALKVNKGTSDASLTAMREVFSEVSKRLDENDGEYIMDQKGQASYGFTAADLTFAALAYPFLSPPQMKLWLMDASNAPDEICVLMKELQATTAGQHVLKMYEKHRLTKDDTMGFVSMKGADRNKYPWQST